MLLGCAAGEIQNARFEMLIQCMRLPIRLGGGIQITAPGRNFFVRGGGGVWMVRCDQTASKPWEGCDKFSFFTRLTHLCGWKTARVRIFYMDLLGVGVCSQTRRLSNK